MADEPEPVGWALLNQNGIAARFAGSFLPLASIATQHDEVIPLYRQQPTLTDAEREAIGRAIDSLEGVEDLLPTAAVNDPADTLRGLLARCAIGHQ